MSNINGDVARIADTLVELKEAHTKGMSKTMVIAWETTLQKHTQELTTLRGKMEEMRNSGVNIGGM